MTNPHPGKSGLISFWQNANVRNVTDNGSIARHSHTASGTRTFQNWPLWISVSCANGSTWLKITWTTSNSRLLMRFSRRSEPGWTSCSKWDWIIWPSTVSQPHSLVVKANVSAWPPRSDHNWSTSSISSTSQASDFTSVTTND